VLKPSKLKGLQIRSQIIRTTETVNLRSLACEIKVAGRLVGESSLWIFTRNTNEEVTPYAPVIILKKEQETQKLHLIFGAVIENSSESKEKEKKKFIFFKRQELPGFTFSLQSEQFASTPSIDSLVEDFVDFKLIVIDNGDDKTCLQIYISEKKMLNVMCNLYVPVLEPSRVMLAGSGNAVYIKELRIRQIDRVAFFRSGIREGNYECCRIL